MSARKRSDCRGCGSRDLALFLSLGETPLANAFLRGSQLSQPEPRFPLDVYFCGKCSLVQLLNVVDPEVMFRNYIYLTGTSETIARHNADLTKEVVQRQGLSGDDLVVEIASNDGSLLKHFQRRGIRTVGVEPACNIAEVARGQGIETITEFFSSKCASEVRRRYGPASVIVANNVLAHVDDTQDFLAGCRSLLKPDGMLVIEVPYLGELLRNLEYDTIYHEHLCYFSVIALMHVYGAAGLAITDLERVSIHGGSLRIYARLGDGGVGHGEKAWNLSEEEKRTGLCDIETYLAFAEKVRASKSQLLDFLHSWRQEGKSIVGYGAPAKGNTLLNFCGIDTALLPYTVDKNSLKVGMYTPGTHIPVLPVEKLLEEQPDGVLVLAWNFAEEIMRQQQTYQRGGGKFVVPIPTPAVL